MNLDTELASRFTCSKCNSRGALVKRFSATGTGFSKLFDVQHNTFIAVSCQKCGYTEIYNPEMLEGKNSAMDIIDFIFGG